MAKFEAKTNFCVEKTGQQFDKGIVYEMTSAEADEINRRSTVHFGEEWLECIEPDVSPVELTESVPEVSESTNFLM
ncbi:TPA: hypothetical protein ACKAQE_001568 [Streptococcus pneumoniae]|uniref:hypothetical protein n=1 Tax=Streptococcus pneumoniae TaxID=1313 RepID=UPI003878F1BF